MGGTDGMGGTNGTNGTNGMGGTDEMNGLEETEPRIGAEERRGLSAVGAALLATWPLQLLTALLCLTAAAGRLPGSPGALLALLRRSPGSSPAQALAQLLASLVGLGVPALLCARAGRLRPGAVFARPKTKAGDAALLGMLGIGFGLFASLAVHVADLLLRSGAHLTLSSPNFQIPWEHPATAAVLLAAVLVAAPLTEEFFFRGVLLRAFRPCGRAFAVVASALCWALAHGDFPQAVPVFVIGLFFGMLALRAESIWPTLALHFLNNLLSVLESAAMASLLGKMASSLINLGLIFVAVILLAVFAKRLLPAPGTPRGPKGAWFALVTRVPAALFLLLCAFRLVLSVRPA